MPILAWQALGASDLVALFLVVLCLAASAMALGVRRWLQHHLHDPYSAWHGANLGALIAGMISFPILAWITWNYVSFPGEFRTLGFLQAVQFGVAEQLPQRRGWIAEILALPFAIESGQLWLIARYGTAVWVTVLYSLSLALVAFVCPSSNKWNSRSDLLMESFVPHGHVTQRIVDNANDASRGSFV